MAVIAIYSVKGGVGKTTLAANLAWCSAMQSYRSTVLWDLDAANGAGYLLGIEPDPRLRAEAMFGIAPDPEKHLVKSAYPNLTVLPADESLRSIEALLSRPGRCKHVGRITNALSRKYERIILDCPPAVNEQSRQILQASDIVIVPLPPSPLSTRAFQRVAKEIKASGHRHPPILPVLSMIDMRRTLHREAREAAPDWPVIPLASAMEQCAVRQKPVGDFATSCSAAKGIGKLWAAIEAKTATFEA